MMIYDYITFQWATHLNIIFLIIVVITSFDKHYYDEDDIKINRLPAGEKASVSSPAKPVELTEEDKKAARDRAIARLAEEQYQTLRKKNVRKKADDNVQQMSLF